MYLQPISMVSKAFGISTRTLRYYEQIGLIAPAKNSDYAYRTYDEDTLIRLRHIIVLRKLRIPLRQIAEIFKKSDAKTAIEAFEKSLKEIEDEISALSTIRSLTMAFIAQLGLSGAVFTLPDDESLLKAVDALTVSKINFKEEKTMDDLNRATETLAKKINVRIIQLPPFTVASHHFIGENPEETVGDIMAEAILDMKLYEIKPDARMFGFNHPNPSKDREFHGYEVWVTIPDDMEVPAPLVKKHFKGGLYAVHTMKFPNFEEWRNLDAWIKDSDKYEYVQSPEGSQNMGGCLEEHLNWVYHNHLGWPEELSEGQLDLYSPVRVMAQG